MKHSNFLEVEVQSRGEGFYARSSLGSADMIVLIIEGSMKIPPKTCL